MKRSEVISLIASNITNLEHDYHNIVDDADDILKALEAAHLIRPTYFTHDKHGLYDIHYGFEPENE